MDIDIFCRVVDNYGDIGVCWRLSKELLYSGNAVTIFVDNLEAFQKIFHAVDPSKNFQICIFKNQKVKLLKSKFGFHILFLFLKTYFNHW